MKRLLFLTFLPLLLFSNCTDRPLDPNKPVYVKIKMTMGDVTVLLYDDTPLHKENFIKLCQENAHDNVLFHRIVQDFVVQGGDPTSKAHEAGVRYGGDGGGYTVPAEILPHYFNKKGALIDAKLGDDVNPERASAGTQFCFVQGKVLTDEELAEKEERINEIRRNWLYHKFRKQLSEEYPALANDEDGLHTEASLMVWDTLAVAGRYEIPEERRQIYKTIGGIPHLDGSVTIFGEVVDGFDVVEEMSLVETDSYDRPVEDVWVKSTKVFQK